ncbi:hypothetical protein LAh8_73 [Aeromonas phage LAh_8]|uniref:Uncharacterized protein n=3 Tax=Lahexavirus TaxID=2843411 RepID=A0A514A001_9CAUD|nr:hypothetical protein HWC29_gp112 [Aeromonas phage 4_4572]YP_009847188.1 hypothetical protein HWC30_gp014 [Aeromonas phage LAh_6]YP_009847411.1 hypothetical protein HWC31_gp073 [Aeromonas phage LAh_8]QDH46604.1 hypothetical protein LAh6_14 [Aeromonas phage LAh_6]QDH46832.1 hypothetical protein LAh8_73 [Aeromonas phage LAh_8]QEG09074.1 hypothetical protein [Aeromonas phage 4_4572]
MQFIIGLFIKAVMSFGVKLLTTLASELMIEWAFFKIAEAIAKSTVTPHDDEWVQKIKQVYEDGKTK